MNKNMIYRCLPDGKSLLEDPVLQPVIENYGRESVKEVIHLELDKLRSRIKSLPEEEEFLFCREELIRAVAENAKKRSSPRMKMVINGTGTILHTNLGRAPIGEKHLENAAKAVSHYSNLEFDLETGKRGESDTGPVHHHQNEREAVHPGEEREAIDDRQKQTLPHR